jgi:hypothetical protein
MLLRGYSLGGIGLVCSGAGGRWNKASAGRGHKTPGTYYSGEMPAARPGA